MTSQSSKGTAFKALHEGTSAFIIPNPWDVGSARILESFGYRALATTSAGAAFTDARPDGSSTREQILENARLIVMASDLPVSADLENGFGDAPEACAETIRLAAQTGLVGGSIEDATGRVDDPIYPLDLALARVKAAIAAARALPFSFMLTARAENYLHGRADLDDTIRRLRAFAEAGADVLYAPGIKSRADIEAVVKAVAPKPVNVLAGLPGITLTHNDLSALGVKRISTGSGPARAAYGALMEAAEEMRNAGTFTYVDKAVPSARINGLFKG